MRKLGQAMVLIPVTIEAYRLGIPAWNSWCIVMLVIIVTGTRAQDPSSHPSTDSLPLQVHKGMDMSHDAYRFEAFDCDKPEDILTKSILHGCSVKALDSEPQDIDSAPKQEYRILQKVVTFD